MTPPMAPKPSGNPTDTNDPTADDGGNPPAPNSGNGVRETLSAKPTNGSGTGGQAPTTNRSARASGGETAESTRPGVDSLPIFQRSKSTSKLPTAGQWGAIHGGDALQSTEVKSYISSGHSSVSMRGGARAPEELVSGPDPPLVNRKYIYGYHGKLLSWGLDDKATFLITVKRLLEYDFNNNSACNFFVDLYPNGLGNPAETTITITDSNYDEKFSNFIKPVYEEPLDEKAAIFVRAGDPPPGITLQPCRQGMKDVVRLHFNHHTSYWKIPRDLFNPEMFKEGKDKKLPYGINQCQPGFVRAMKLLFDLESPRPRGLVRLKHLKENGETGRSWNLGFSGVEVTEEFWNAVCERALELDPGKDDAIEFAVEIDTRKIAKGEIGSHLTGSNHEAIASISDANTTYGEIIAMSKGWLRERKVPGSIRIWHNAEERELGQDGKVIALKPKSAAVDTLKEYFQEWESRTYCCWWRPEHDVFNVETQKKKQGEVQWDTKEGSLTTLEDFRKSTATLSTDGKALQSFILLEAQSEDDARRFLVNADTTESEWRVHIYDWLHNKNLFVEEYQPIHYSKFDIP